MGVNDYLVGVPGLLKFCKIDLSANFRELTRIFRVFAKIGVNLRTHFVLCASLGSARKPIHS